MLEAVPDFRADVLRSAVEGDEVFVEVHWTGTNSDGAALEERGVLMFGIGDERSSAPRTAGTSEPVAKVPCARHGTTGGNRSEPHIEFLDLSRDVCLFTTARAEKGMDSGCIGSTVQTG